jgi:hypothetical protein
MSPSASPRTGCDNWWRRRSAGRCQRAGRTGATFADAAAEWLRNIEHDRLRAISGRDLSSLLRSQILPAFADRALEVITPAMIESWIACVDRTAATRVKLL